jgi:predicted nucleic acid-binding protein
MEYHYSFWDSLIVQAVIISKSEYRLSEDSQMDEGDAVEVLKQLDN